MAAQFHCETGSLRGALLPRERGRAPPPSRIEEEEEPAEDLERSESCRTGGPGVHCGVRGGTQGRVGFLCTPLPACRAPACAGWRAAGSPSGLNCGASFLQGVLMGGEEVSDFPRKVIKVQSPQGI